MSFNFHLFLLLTNVSLLLISLTWIVSWLDLDRIVTQIVKPKVSVYMAIDGVAPRAKMNQQRSRRFRSAKDLAEATKDKRIFPADAADPYSGAFDSNCITPGTEFLLRISECIRYFIRKKIKEDPLWKNLSVIFSGPEVPGEGEHKVSFTKCLVQMMNNDFLWDLC